MTPNKNRSRKYWVLMSIQFSDIYMLRKYIYTLYIYIYTHVIICIYIWLMLKILYYFGMLKNLWIFCDLCYLFMFTLSKWSIFSSINRNFNWWIFFDFWPRNSLGFLLSSIQVMLGLLWQNDVNTCVCPEICVFVWTYLHNICMMYVYDIYIYVCVIWQTRRTFLMMMHIYLRMLICIFPSKKVKTMAEDLPHSVDVKEKTWSFRHRTRTADHRRKLTRSSGSTWIWWISSWVSYGTPSIGSDDAKTSEKKGQQKRHDVWRSAWASWRKRCIKNFERVFFWLCGS